MMNSDKVQYALDRLETGIQELTNSERWKQFLRFMSAFHNYSFSNQLLIMLQKPDATHVLGYQTWKKFGRHVKAGEKGIFILAPVRMPVSKKKSAEAEGQDTVDPQQQENGQSLYATVGFKGAHVFDVSQTEGQPLPESVVRRLTGECAIYTDLLECCPFPVRELDSCGGANGYYRRKEKDIAILASLPEKQKVKTLIHEWAHGLLHGDDTTRPERKGVRELEAESTAFVVCNALGIDTSNYSFGYIASWASEDDATQLIKVCGNRIQKAAHLILGGIETDLAVFEAV